MSHRRHKPRKRSRSRSPSSRRNSVSSPDVHHEGSPPKRRRTKTIPFRRFFSQLKVFLSSLESQANCSEAIADTDDDILSIMADDSSGLEISEHLATEASSNTTAMPVGAPVAPTKAPTESNMTFDEAANSAKSNDDYGLNDPLAKSTSWITSASLQISGYYLILPAIPCYSGRLGNS